MKSKSYNGQAIPINRDNVDTDLIIPKQYLKSIKKSGFGPFLFDSLRYNDTATLDSNNERKTVNLYSIENHLEMEILWFQKVISAAGHLENMLSGPYKIMALMSLSQKVLQIYSRGIVLKTDYCSFL